MFADCPSYLSKVKSQGRKPPKNRGDLVVQNVLKKNIKTTQDKQYDCNAITIADYCDDTVHSEFLGTLSLIINKNTTESQLPTVPLGWIELKSVYDTGQRDYIQTVVKNVFHPKIFKVDFLCRKF